VDQIEDEDDGHAVSLRGGLDPRQLVGVAIDEYETQEHP
jgi:hypothetical protein